MLVIAATVVMTFLIPATDRRIAMTSQGGRSLYCERSIMAKPKVKGVQEKEEKTFDWQAHVDEFRDYISEDLWPLVKPVEWYHVNPVNSLEHTDTDLDMTAASLREFGQRSTVFYNKTSMKISAGNGRYLAATKKLGWKYMAFAGEEDDLLTETRWGLADNLTGRAAKFNIKNAAEMVKSMGDEGKSIPGMTDEIFNGWTDDDPIGEDGPPDDWQEYDESLETSHICPKCGFEYSD
jgi:hypothetical protein